MKSSLEANKFNVLNIFHLKTLKIDFVYEEQRLELQSQTSSLFRVNNLFQRRVCKRAEAGSVEGPAPQWVRPRQKN